MSTYAARLGHISPGRDEEPIELGEVDADSATAAHSHFSEKVKELEDAQGTLQVYLVDTD